MQFIAATSTPHRPRGPEVTKHARSQCPVACTLDLIGDKWTLLVVRDLFLGRRYFKDFLASPERIATNILSNRLVRLVDAGLVRTIPETATIGRNSYRLTDKGEALLPVLDAITAWGLRHLDGTSVRLAPRAPDDR